MKISKKFDHMGDITTMTISKSQHDALKDVNLFVASIEEHTKAKRNTEKKPQKMFSLFSQHIPTCKDGCHMQGHHNPVGHE